MAAPGGLAGHRRTSRHAYRGQHDHNCADLCRGSFPANGHSPETPPVGDGSGVGTFLNRGKVWPRSDSRYTAEQPSTPSIALLVGTGCWLLSRIGPAAKAWCQISGEIWLDPSIQLGHYGMYEFTADPMGAFTPVSSAPAAAA